MLSRACEVALEMRKLACTGQLQRVRVQLTHNLDFRFFLQIPNQQARLLKNDFFYYMIA